jgi:hypothetical protein
MYIYTYMYMYTCIYIIITAAVNAELENSVIADIQVVEIKDITEGEEVEDFVAQKGITY